MADKQGYYWDHNECGWVRCPTAVPASAPTVEIPEQAVPEPRAVESAKEADVRSG